jgi:2-keto-3-deoxy-L-rhamnonate aldolase RhmA
MEKLSPNRTLVGTFVKTPSSEVIEILALAGLDFICFDAEHSAFGRRELDWCLAFSRALSLPALVRLSHFSADAVLQALDGGAAGIVVPHVDCLQTAEEVARRSRFGRGGRGYAGSTRSAGFTTQTVAQILDEEKTATFVIAQIEDPSALDDLVEIASVPGIDALFFGAADMAVGLGLMNTGEPEVEAAFDMVLKAAASAGKPVAAYCSTPGGIGELRKKGVSFAFVSSDQGLVLSGAKAIAAAAAR